MLVNERYDAFQKEAVANIVADLRADPKGRYLLVIPTGGGKTTTAVKAMRALFTQGVLAPSDRAMWVVHRDELRTQALETFDRFPLAEGAHLRERVDVLMLSQIQSYLAENPKVRFAVIDEAHHAPAKSYQPIFDRSAIGILGLTATPSRHDGQPLQFSRESYSIGFPDLVSIGVLLRPNVIQVRGGRYEITDIDEGSESLEILNNAERNAKIIQALKDHADDLHKIIIYAGTKNHARQLYELLKRSHFAVDYQSVSLILGDDRRRFTPADSSEVQGESRKDFIEFQKSFDRAIIVNVDVLTEGYDDPTVNTVVMARPTKSKLVYMQALGRAVRINPRDVAKEAFVIEVIDDLPNIKYRIDNRWLYSDISDQLEPNVIDVFYSSHSELRAKIEDVFNRFNVPTAHRQLPAWRAAERVTLLLFKVYVGPDRFEHRPVVITNDTRQSAAAFFNFLASRMAKVHGLNIEQLFKPVLSHALRFPTLQDAPGRREAFSAMENAWDLVAGNEASNPLQAGHPWITFVAFRLQIPQAGLGSELLAFTEDMLNKRHVLESLKTGSVDKGFVLVKIPLPLRGTWGVFLSKAEFEAVKSAIEKMRRTTAAEPDATYQWEAAVSLLGKSTAPMEQWLARNMTTIVRERMDYFRILSNGIIQGGK
jgi:superfamily II DNA or RNA helicase